MAWDLNFHVILPQQFNDVTGLRKGSTVFL